MPTKKHNSLNDSSAQMMRNNQNTIELLTKLDQSLNSNESYVSAKTVDAKGNEVISQIPTIGYFKQQLDQVIKTIQSMAGLDGNSSAIQIAENSFKRIITSDLNTEPNPIPQLPSVSTFKTDPNWIFDSFLNPMISVELDLTNKIDLNTRTILSKRFIIKFEEVVSFDENNNEVVELSTNGALRKAEFDSKYKGKSDINMVEFITWLDSPGLLNSTDDNLIDQDKFKLEPNRLQYKGNFTIQNTELDTINKKLWYVLDSLTYYDVSDPAATPKPIDLKIGDLIKINPSVSGQTSATVYKVVEISTITSDLRVRFEQVFGSEPIPIRINAISIYSEVIPQKYVKISVGFDEYSVLFIKQLDDYNNIVGLEYSPGIGFYTNELRLENESGELFSEYYINTVYDYGLVLKDLVAKKVPNYYGIKPNAPVLDNTNFQVVQINSHLTQTVEAEKIRDMHNEKNNIASQISQIQTTIENQNRKISTTKYTSNADKKRANDELISLRSQLDAKSKSKSSIIADILASKKNLNKIAPLFNLRGFFAMPEAVKSTKTKPQEIVQFEIWYRKLSKSGDENPILTISDINNSAAQKASTKNTLTTNVFKPKVVNGSFSNWQKYKTDSRKRSQDPITGEWLWSIEDVSDANTPNINQIDLPLLPGERIEIKVRSLSEVGWPETPIESEFSNVLTYDFPDDKNNILNEDEFILKEAQADELKVQFDRDLEARGLNLHLNTALRDTDIYYAHSSDTIASGFRDNNGKIINLYDKLLLLTSKIATLEETINRSKGILDIYLVNRGNQTKIFSGNNMSFNINLEDYMTTTKIGLASSPVDSIARTYKNELLFIDDFSIVVSNTAETADLGILSYRGYGSPLGKQSSQFVYNPQGITTGELPQAIWIQPDSTILMQDIPENASTSVYQAPRYATQQNNQWIWLQSADISGADIYHTNGAQPDNQFWNSTVLSNGASLIHDSVIQTDKNLGFTTGTNQTQTPSSNPITEITYPRNWQINENPTSGGTVVGSMGSTIHPVISNFNAITEASSQLIKFIKTGDTNSITIPLNIYAKTYTGTGVYEFTTAGINVNANFNDTANITDGGDMPEVATGLNVGKSNTNKLIILLSTSGANSIDIVNPDDRLIIDGFTATELLGANNKVLTVTRVGPTTGLLINQIEVSYDPTTITGISTALVAGGNAIIKQLHKRYVNGSNGGQLYNYNVLGQIGSDDRYVNNYVEIVSTTATPNPIKHNKKLRFYLEDENNIRPIEFQLNFNISQYKSTLVLGNHARNTI